MAIFVCTINLNLAMESGNGNVRGLYVSLKHSRPFLFVRSKLDALRDRERALNALNMVEGVSGCPLVFLH